ncbi:MAG: ATP-binding protein [Beijerinckiaceae bacterium]
MRLRRLAGTTAFKLSIVYLLASALFASALISYVGWNARRLIDEQIGQTLTAQINGLADQYRIGGIRRLTAVIERRSREPGSFLFMLQGATGETIAGNISGISNTIFTDKNLVETRYQRLEDEGQTREALVRSFALPGNNRLLVGRDLEERERLNVVLNQAIRILLGALLVFGGLGSFLVARKALARMDALTATSQTIMAGDLSGRLPVSGSGDELDRLAGSLNAMLERIGELMQGMKEVSDNIAHDLKTPLTRLRNTAEQALRTGQSKADYRAALERSIEESDGLIRTFNALLLIARTEAGAGSDAFTPVDISSLLKDMTEIYGPSVEDTGGTLVADIAPGIRVLGNRELLGQVIANLIDNALKYGFPLQASSSPVITLSARQEMDRVVVTVADHGPGIHASQREKAVERFGRLDESRNKPGSGLGLSLASAAANLHKGRLILDDNRPGLRISLELPAQLSAP